ncbi:unknown [Acinetobacter sp. CAG:196]|nr:unknown [Acinetobacter sp. CAG:196]
MVEVFPLLTILACIPNCASVSSKDPTVSSEEISAVYLTPLFQILYSPVVTPKSESAVFLVTAEVTVTFPSTLFVGAVFA